MTENLYRTPESDPTLETDSTLETGSTLASRGSRFGASLLDGIFMALISVPVIYFIEQSNMLNEISPDSFLFNVTLSVTGIMLFFVLNFKFLKDNGQTIGKKIVGIKVVDLNGDKAMMKDHLLKRYLTFLLPSQIPVVGSIFQLVNVLCIFREDRRCIHDLAANTKVIFCNERLKSK